MEYFCIPFLPTQALDFDAGRYAPPMRHRRTSMRDPGRSPTDCNVAWRGLKMHSPRPRRSRAGIPTAHLITCSRAGGEGMRENFCYQGPWSGRLVPLSTAGIGPLLFLSLVSCRTVGVSIREGLFHRTFRFGWKDLSSHPLDPAAVHYFLDGVMV